MNLNKKTVRGFQKLVFGDSNATPDTILWKDDKYKLYEGLSTSKLLSKVEKKNYDRIEISLQLGSGSMAGVCGICWPSPILHSMPIPTLHVRDSEGVEFAIFLFDEPVDEEDLEKYLDIYNLDISDLTDIPLPGSEGVKTKKSKKLARYKPEEVFKFVDLDQQISISHGPKAQTGQGFWDTVNLTLGEFFEELAEHQPGAKDGSCFLQGQVAGKKRTAKSVTQNYLIAFDLDTGETGEEIDNRLSNYGYAYTRYTTHSHLSNISQIKRDMFFKYFDKDPSGKVLPEDVARYLTEVKGYRSEVIDELEVLEEAQGSEDGVLIIVEHNPMEKHRIVFALNEPFVFQGAFDQLERIKEWRELYHGFGAELGFKYDQKVTDPSRLFYFPRHAKGTNDHVTKTVMGTSVRLEDFERLPMAKHNSKSRASDDDPKRYKVQGRDLKFWASKKAPYFELVYALQQFAPEDAIREDRMRGGVTMECPFEHEHSKAGGKGFFAIDASENDEFSEGFVAMCSHDSCAHRDRLDFLKGMIENEWLPLEILDRGRFYDGMAEEIEDDDEGAYLEEGSYRNIDGEELLSTRDIYSDPDVKRKMMQCVGRYAYTTIGGASRVMIDRGKREFPTFIQMGTFHDRLANDRIRIELNDDKVINEKVSKLYMESHYRVDYDRVVFEPNLKEPIPRAYNKFNGFHIEPDPTKSWDLLKDHILVNLCDGNEMHYNFLLTFIAQIIQEPWRKAGACLVLQGEKGVGKSTLGNYITDLLGKYSMTATHAKHLTGNFNAHLEATLFVLCEEAVWAGDKQDNSALKSLITDPNLLVEQKGIDAFQARNCTRVMMISNEGWVIPAGLPADERRYFVLKVQAYRKKDFAYFKAIDRQMRAEGGLEAMMHDMMNWVPPHPDGWDWLRDPPVTVGLKEQAMNTIPEYQRFFFDFIGQGYLAAIDDNLGLDVQLSDESETIVPKEVIRRHFSAQMSRSVQSESRSMANSAQKFGKLCKDNLLVSNLNAKKSFRDTPYEFCSAVSQELDSKEKGRGRALVIPPRKELIDFIEKSTGLDLNEMY